jgi:hypothetical protein
MIMATLKRLNKETALAEWFLEYSRNLFYVVKITMIIGIWLVVLILPSLVLSLLATVGVPVAISSNTLGFIYLVWLVFYGAAIYTYVTRN